MPLYEYRCDSCGRRFEVLQRMGEGSEGLACPDCGAAKPERLLSSFAAGSGGDGGAAGAARSGCGPGGFT